MQSELYIVMPAYNEEANIKLVVEQWHSVIEKVSLNSRLVIFDDGSKDNTFKIMTEMVQYFPQLIPITKANSGHGDTLLIAYNYCIKANVQFVFQTDSDGQTSPEEFWDFWQNRTDYDFIIGYRKNREDGFSRKLVAHVLKFLVLLYFRTYVKDSNTPFRLMRVDKLRTLITHIPANFFLPNVILSMLIVKHKEKHLWLPITFKNRQGGVNSINLKRIFKIGLNSIIDFNKVRF